MFVHFAMLSTLVTSARVDTMEVTNSSLTGSFGDSSSCSPNDVIAPIVAAVILLIYSIIVTIILIKEKRK